MTHQVSDLYLNRAKIVMELLGVWVPGVNEMISQKVYKILMLTLQYSFLLFQVIYVVQVWGDLEAVSQAVYVLFTQACLCCKIAVFHVNIDSVKDLLYQMNSDVFKPQCAEQERILKLRAKSIKRLLLYFIVAAEVTCIVWGLIPLLNNGNIRQFPFEMWMPVKPDTSPQYEFGYLFQEITICTSALMYYGVDSVAISMVIYACAQMEIIMAKILSIKSYGSTVTDDNETNLEDYYRNGNNKLTECVKHHQAIITFTELVEDTFHIYMLFQLIGTVGIIVMSAFNILLLEMQDMQFASTIIYLIVMVSQIFLCCWSGHELTATSEKLHTVLYKSVWYEQDLKFQRALCLAMTRMKHSLVLRAGHYIILSRQTFVAILRMSYSYFAVLNQTM